MMAALRINCPDIIDFSNGASSSKKVHTLTQQSEQLRPHCFTENTQ